MNRLTQTELNEIRQRAEKAAAGADAEFIAHVAKELARQDETFSMFIDILRGWKLNN